MAREEDTVAAVAVALVVVEDTAHLLCRMVLLLLHLDTPWPPLTCILRWLMAEATRRLSRDMALLPKVSIRHRLLRIISSADSNVGFAAPQYGYPDPTQQQPPMPMQGQQPPPQPPQGGRGF